MRLTNFQTFLESKKSSAYEFICNIFNREIEDEVVFVDDLSKKGKKIQGIQLYVLRKVKEMNEEEISRIFNKFKIISDKLSSLGNLFFFANSDGEDGYYISKANVVDYTRITVLPEMKYDNSVSIDCFGFVITQEKYPFIIDLHREALMNPNKFTYFDEHRSSRYVVGLDLESTINLILKVNPKNEKVVEAFAGDYSYVTLEEEDYNKHFSNTISSKLFKEIIQDIFINYIESDTFGSELFGVMLPNTIVGEKINTDNIKKLYDTLISENILREFFLGIVNSGVCDEGEGVCGAISEILSVFNEDVECWQAAAGDLKRELVSQINLCFEKNKCFVVGFQTMTVGDDDEVRLFIRGANYNEYCINNGFDYFDEAFGKLLRQINFEFDWSKYLKRIEKFTYHPSEGTRDDILDIWNTYESSF
jgi:hypothetical protein